MKNKLKYYIKEILSFIVMLFIISNVVSYYKSSNINKSKFDIENISLTNKPILVYFWATWCPICKVESPNIQTLSKDYQVVTIAVNSGDDKKISNYLNENNFDFKVINDKNSSYANKFNIEVFPTTLIYDKDKNLIFSEVGYTSTFGLKLRLWWAGL